MTRKLGGARELDGRMMEILMTSNGWATGIRLLRRTSRDERLGGTSRDYKKKKKRLSETSGDDGSWVAHSRVCRFMSASFLTTGFGRSGNTETTRLASVDKGQGVLEGQ